MSSRAGSPQPVGRSLSTTESRCLIATQQRKQQEMAQPHVFLHTPMRLGHIIAFYMSGGRGGVRSMWGKGSNTKQVAQSHAPELETAHANYRQKSPTSRSAEIPSSENTTENNGPATLRSQGRAAPPGLPLRPFQVEVPLGMLGTPRSFPTSPAVRTSLLHSLGSPLVSPGPPATRSSRQDAAPLTCWPGTAEEPRPQPLTRTIPRSNGPTSLT